MSLSDSMKQNKEHWGFDFVFATLWFLITYYILNRTGDDRVLVSFLVSVLALFVGEYLYCTLYKGGEHIRKIIREECCDRIIKEQGGEHIRKIVREECYDRIIEELSNHDAKIERRLSPICEHFALGTSGRSFSNLIASIRGKSQGPMWASLKFLQKAMSIHFEDKAAVTVGLEGTTAYINILGELVSECRNSIVMTCPYLPEEWFSHSVDRGKFGSIMAGEIELEDMPRHFRILYSGRNGSSNGLRIDRYVNLTPHQWTTFLSDMETRPGLVRSFLRHHPDLNRVWIVKDPTLDTPNNGKIVTDFQLLDEQLVLWWRDDVCSLLVSDFNSYLEYIEYLKSDATADCRISGEQVMAKLVDTTASTAL